METEKRQKEAEVEAKVLFGFQIWTGLGQITPERDVAVLPLGSASVLETCSCSQGHLGGCASGQLQGIDPRRL